jgi:hypothetical protein
MNPDPIIHVVIKGSFPTFADVEFDKLTTVCKGIGEGVEAEMVLRKPRKQRSTPQNAYYWGVIIKMISDHTGEEPDRIHGALASMFLKVYDWMGKERIKSTTELSTVEFEKYAESCRQWASIALEMYIPLPNEAEIPKEYQLT